MQVFISFPDAGYLDVVFDVVSNSLVADAIQAAADEWGSDAEFLEMSFSGSVLPPNSRLMAHGVEGGSQLTVSLLRVFGCKWFSNRGKRAQLWKHLSDMDERHITLDTPSFTTDGHFKFDLTLVPDGFEVSFINPHPSITTASFKPEPESDSDFDLAGLNGVWDCYETYDYGLYESLVSKVDLTGLKYITSTGDEFMANCKSITSQDISCLSEVTTIGRDFLFECSSLSSLQLMSLCKVTTIHGSFLSKCSSLSSLDLTSLTNITSIGNDFLLGCSSLVSLDLASLVNLTAIGDRFLADCTSLSAVDLTTLNNVTSIGNMFLIGCRSLSSLDLRSLHNITSIGQSFLSYCSSLSTLKLANLDNVKIGNYFLDECRSLSKVNVRKSMKMS
eukprot:TRINITY_DN5790_c0_g1_i1.p1 TRINITY_DN5790_c0_g1~~TRINITY_DN5790_c0_g1_i1.p1  ORF type:complete len:404 (+),score=51.36 TRINITY_DN5790_c0_g1_i1:48-1214(+)